MRLGERFSLLRLLCFLWQGDSEDILAGPPKRRPVGNLERAPGRVQSRERQSGGNRMAAKKSVKPAKKGAKVSAKKIKAEKNMSMMAIKATGIKW
jgi:hypothetical protein